MVDKSCAAREFVFSSIAGMLKSVTPTPHEWEMISLKQLVPTDHPLQLIDRYILFDFIR